MEVRGDGGERGWWRLNAQAAQPGRVFGHRIACLTFFWAGTCLEAFDPAALIAESWEMALNWRAQEGQARRLATRINDVTKDNGTCLQGTRGPVTYAQ